MQRKYLGCCWEAYGAIICLMIFFIHTPNRFTEYWLGQYAFLWLMPAIALSLALGVAFSISSIRHKESLNKKIGIISLLLFIAIFSYSPFVNNITIILKRFL